MILNGLQEKMIIWDNEIFDLNYQLLQSLDVPPEWPENWRRIASLLSSAGGGGREAVGGGKTRRRMKAKFQYFA